MTGWQSRLARRISIVENYFDAMRLELLARYGSRKRLTIIPYIGHANRQTLFLRGRVMLDNNIKPPTETDGIWTNLHNMYKRFESDEIAWARVRAEVDGASVDVVCDDEGFFEVSLQPEDGIHPDGYWQPVNLKVINTPIKSIVTTGSEAVGQVIVPPENAQFAVVSDLDDTILRTDVLNIFKMLRNTILRNAYTRLPFEGVAKFYHALQTGTRNTRNPIFYVSSSPWNLYDVINDFFKIRGIPPGPIYLRDVGITGDKLVAKGHLQHKVSIIQNLMDVHSQLPFILIGDSGQKDARVYLEVVRNNPGRVRAIYIRDVAKVKRANAVNKIAQQVKGLGTEMLLVRDTSEAAQHAADHGLIRPDYLPQIFEECHRDEVQGSVLERIFSDSQTGDF